MNKTARLKDVEDRAASALYANDVQNAWELYSEAMEICLKYGIEEDYKRVLSCKSMAATMLKKNEEALIDSISYFMIDQHTEQGYWLAAMTHIKHGNRNAALDYFLKGFKIALEPSVFLVEIVHCLVTLKSSKEKDACTQLFERHQDLNVTKINTDTLKLALEKLCEIESWKCLSLLVIGKHPGPKTDFDRLASQCPASNVSVGKMLKKLSTRKKQKFGFQLATACLKNGASFEEIEKVFETPAVHVGLRMFLETEKDILLHWFLKHHLTEQSMKDKRNVNGDTAVHVLVKSSIENTNLKQRVLKCLLENGCSPSLCDLDGKLPHDCITADDPCFQILVSASLSIDQTSCINIEITEKESLIQLANKFFDQSRFNDALELYKKAMEMPTPGEKDVKIQCAIIECFLKMKEYKGALDFCLSINESTCGSETAKVYVLRGYALTGLRNWSEAFSAFVNAAIRFHDNDVFGKDIVVNIANSYTECFNIKNAMVTKQIDGLCATIKCCIVWELVNRGDWNAAHRFYTKTLCTRTDSLDHEELMTIDIKPICTLAVLSKHQWLSGFITSLVLNGMLEFRNIKVMSRKKKSYKGLHACIMISSVTGDKSLVELVSKQAKESNQQNEQDFKGNSALHLAVNVYRALSEHGIAQTVVELLLMNGVNPLLENNEKKTARSCIAKTNNELSKILLKYETKLIKQMSKEEEEKEMKKKFEIDDQLLFENLKTDEFVKAYETPSENVSLKCNCKSTLQNIKERTDFSQEKVRLLMEVIRKDHKSSTHLKVQQEGASLIANAVSKEDAPEIMTAMLEISRPVYETFLHELLHLKKWETLNNVLRLHKDIISNSSLNILVDTLIEKVEREETIAELLETLMDGGNIIVKDYDILVKKLLKRKLFRILRVLFHHNIDATLLSFYPGDTPIHAAVCIGLEYEHENLAIFEDFTVLYKKDKRKYECLNPYQLDANGSSLVDIISDKPETARKHKLMKTLEDLHMPGKHHLMSDEQKTYDYLEEMSTKETIESLEQQLLDDITKLSPGFLHKSKQRPIDKMLLEKTNKQNNEMDGKTNAMGTSFSEIDLKTLEYLPWEIECTYGFKKNINSTHVSVLLRKRAFECIKELAEGSRKTNLCKPLRHKGNQDIKLFEIKLDKAVRIIWEKAINFSPRLNMIVKPESECDVIYSEVIRIWDIVLNHDRIHACVENIVQSYKKCEIFRLSYSPKQMDSIKQSTDMEVPRKFQKRDTNELKELGENEQNFYISVNPNVTKFYELSQDLVIHALEQLNVNDVSIPFKVTDLEYVFIKLKFDTPILLLGRSGTGKTTCCIYKLWAIYEEYWKNREMKFDSKSDFADSKESDDKRMHDVDNSTEDQLQQIDPKDGLRQLFVTKNPILCLEAERNFIELNKSSAVQKGFSPSERKTSYEMLQDISEQEYPLFLTFQQLLELLDVSIGPPYFLANSNLFDKDASVDLAQFQNNYDIFSDFSSDDDDLQSQELSEKIKSKIKKKSKKNPQRKLLTYETFEKDIWSKINNKKGTNCHASLVWTEIRSFIKGSFAALDSSKGHLTLEQYKEIGKKMAPLFQDDRDLIYEMFLCYERLKKNSHYVDEGDVTFNLFHRMENLRKDIYFHELYVDETQDFTNAELCILIQLCSIPNRIFLTGDTAQCIMHGISFRFKDLKSLFFEINKTGRVTVNVPEKVYHLPHNYRSHAGILNLATSVLDILKNLFPDSFDELGDDKGMMNGPKPVILQNSKIEDLHLLLNRSERETSKIDLGAHQVVLVANEETKKIVKSAFQKCLVLTIDCAKGLEFDDVLLFNFFKDSHATGEWRVVTSFLKMLIENDLQKPNCYKKIFTELCHNEILTNLSPRPLEFDPRKHKILNSELKRLYTALTRARTNVWIFDEDEESRSPMFDYFIKRNLVEVKDDDSLKTFSNPSESEDWCKQGETFFLNRRFDLAAEYFRNGSDINMVRLAQAYHEKQQARKSMDEKSKKYHLMRAAHLFFKCQKTTKAEKCLLFASQYKCLGHFYERTRQLDDAVNMYKKAILPLDQSRCFEELEYFGKAISVLVESAKFADALECLKKVLSQSKSEDKIPESLDSVSKICAKAADYFGKMQNNSKFLEFTEHIECPEERFDMLLKYEFIDEAFRLKMPKGTKDEQFDFYIQCGAVQNALHILKDCVENKDIKQFQCTLIMGQIAVQKKDKKNVKEIEEKLIQIIQDSSNLVTVGKARLLIGQLMHNKQHIGQAFELLENDKRRGFFFQFECIDWMMTKCNLSNGNELIEITQYLKKFMNLGSGIRGFLKSDSVFREERFHAMCAFYDFYCYEGRSYRLYPRQFPLGMKMMEENHECQKFEICFDKPVLKALCKKYLRTKFHYWKKQLIRAFSEKRKHFKRSKNVDKVTQFNIISITAAYCLSNLSFCNVERQREIFVSDLYSTLFLDNCVNKQCENVSVFLQDIDLRFVMGPTENLQEVLEKIGSHNEREIAKFIGFFLMTNLLQCRNLFPVVPIANKSDSDLSKAFQSFFDSLVQMEVTRAVCEFCNFCYLISKESSIPFPCDIFMLFSEMFLIIAFYITARSHGETCWFVVPQNYSDSLRHVENLFLQKNSVMKKICDDNRPKPELACLTNMIHILGSSCTLNLFQRSNKQTEDRILALGFTVLCNLGGILNIIIADCIKLESNLAKGIYQNLKRNRHEKIRQAMSKANNLIDFYKPLDELLILGGHKLLWCKWDKEHGLTYTTEEDVHHFEDIPIQNDTRIAITEPEIDSESAEGEISQDSSKSTKLPITEFLKPKIDDKKMRSSKKKSKRKGCRKLDSSIEAEQSGNNSSTQKDETNEQTTEYRVKDLKEAVTTELCIEDVDDQHKISIDNAGATDSYLENAELETDAEEKKEGGSGQSVEIVDKSSLENENVTDGNDDDCHDAKRLPNSDDNLGAASTDIVAGHGSFENISIQKELHDDDQPDEYSFGPKKLTDNIDEGFPGDKLLTDGVSVIESRDTNIEDFEKEFTEENPSPAVLPETNTTMHATDIEGCYQHTHLEDIRDATLNDIRYLFKVQNMELMDNQDVTLTHIRYLFEDNPTENTS